jgi:hypothetical protein
MKFLSKSIFKQYVIFYCFELACSFRKNIVYALAIKILTDGIHMFLSLNPPTPRLEEKMPRGE